MMPNLSMAARKNGRRVSGQVVKQTIVDHEAVIKPIDQLRATITILPMPPQRIIIKQEGQRTWKWWQGTSPTRLEKGWFVKPDKDRGRLYEVMEVGDCSQAGFYQYEFAEAPR